MLHLLVAGIAAILPLAVSAHIVPAKGPFVTLINGTYRGVHNDAYNQDFFLGVPYAQPPVGHLRFSRPARLNTSFESVRQATAYGADCPGVSPFPGHTMSEDCLTINVIRPSGFENASLPVALWIYGGSYNSGSSSYPSYNLSFMVQESVNAGMPIIGASLNYRVGPFGFLQSKDIRATGATNLGLRDVYLGLEWMQENIAAFGGDPSKVTIWGESAGAGVVGHMTTAFGGSREGLFRGAIAQSGGPLMFFPPSESLQESTYKGYLKGTGCDHAQDRIDCLRDVPWETIQNLTGNVVGQFNPTVDGDIVPERSSLLLAQGNFTKIPLLIGANTADGAAFAPQGINNDTSLYNYLRNLGLDDRTVENLLLLYPDIPGYGAPPTYVGRPNSTIGVQYQRAGQLINDFYYHRGRRYTAQYWSKYKVPVYTYHFGVWPLPGLSELQGTTHYFETPFVFYNLDGAGLDPQNAISSFPQVYTDLAKLMCRSWISFVHDLNPNKRPQSSTEAEALTPKWPIYAPNGELALEGYGENFHFDLNVTGAAYIERDIYRSPGIAYWFSNEVQKQIGS